jgi:hypothetical protein
MRRTTLSALLLAATLPALADRPLASETADVIDDGACQAEAWGGRATASDSPALRELSGAFSCGVGSSTQLAFSATDERSGGVTVRTLRAGGKTTLVAPAAGRTGFGVAYGADNVHVQGEGSKFDNIGVTGLLTQQVAPHGLLHLNLGWNRSRAARQNSTVWSVGFETTTNPTLAADVYGDDRGRPGTSAGVGFAFTRDFSVNAMVAQQWTSPAVRQWTLGAKLVF